MAKKKNAKRKNKEAPPHNNTINNTTKDKPKGGSKETAGKETNERNGKNKQREGGGNNETATPIGQSKKSKPAGRNSERKHRRLLTKITELLRYTILLLLIVGLLLVVLIYEERLFGSKQIHTIQQSITTQLQAINDKYWANIFTLVPTIQLYEPSRPGQLLKSQNSTLLPHRVRVKHPVVIIPGIVSTKLEVWESKECASHSFRTQYWGSSSMLQSMILKPKCWLEHIALNHTTGLDPDHIKLRPMSGMDAADFFIGDYYIWARVLQNLADVGYDPNSIFMASYDWRLSLQNLEIRDFYFSKLKSTIELLKKQNRNNKVVVLAHSMGSIVFQYFLQWVESDQGGNGGPHWVDSFIHSYVNIGGPLLGVPKAASALISGEMRDTADLHSVLDYIKENFISRSDLLSVFRSFWSLTSMLPKGGDKIWGNINKAGDELLSPGFNPGKLLDFSDDSSIDDLPTHQRFRGPDDDDLIMEIFKIKYDECEGEEEKEIDQSDREEINKIIGQKAISIDGYLSLMRVIAKPYMEKMDQIFSFGIAHNFSDPVYKSNSKYWANPLESQLPNAPAMKIYSLYGINKATERSYFYKQNEKQCDGIPFTLNKQYSRNSHDVYHGVFLSDGDGTVPLLSLGFMSVKGWLDERYNPHKLKCITREYEHKPQSTLEAGGDLGARLRGGSTTADHVDILGNSELLMDILLIATGNDELVGDRIFSKIREIADQIHL